MDVMEEIQEQLIAGFIKIILQIKVALLIEALDMTIEWDAQTK